MLSVRMAAATLISMATWSHFLAFVLNTSSKEILMQVRNRGVQLSCVIVGHRRNTKQD